MRRRFLPVIALILAFTIIRVTLLYGQSENGPRKHALAMADMKGRFTFMIASDMGRNGYYDQRPVAETMGEAAVITKPKFVAALGDMHHFLGVRSVRDPLWETNFEWIYKHPALMIPWHPVLGNHEYRGTTQAVIDYSTVSRRWEMPARYYAITRRVTKDVDVLLLFIDTAPLIDAYRNKPAEFGDACKQSMESELAWIDSTLGASGARWKIVMGHHPVYAGAKKSGSERRDLQKRLQPLLDKHHVDISVGGHIHNFQHIRVPGSDVDYFVNGSASKSREVVPFKGALFGSPETGFSLCTVTKAGLIITFVNKEGKIIYQYTRRK